MTRALNILVCFDLRAGSGHKTLIAKPSFLINENVGSIGGGGCMAILILLDGTTDPPLPG